MRHRTLGTSGLSISAVGLGTWTLGGGEGDLRWPSTAERDAVDTVHRAVEVGVNWIDTAPVYGDGRAEAVLGRALRTLLPRDRPMIFTKCGLSLDRASNPVIDVRPARLRAECDASLQRLGVEHIDVLQIHWPPDDPEALREGWTTLQELCREGKVRCAGASNFSLSQLEACHRSGSAASSQVALSLIERQRLTDLAATRQLGVGGLVYSVLQSGLLSGAFRADRLQRGDWRRNAPLRFAHQLNFREPALSRNLALAERVAAIAREIGVSTAELALAWALAWPGVDGAIVGARNPGQVDGWMGASDLEIDRSSLDELAGVIARSGAGSGPATPTEALARLGRQTDSRAYS